MQFLCIGTAETERAPGTIFTIQQLVRLFQFLIIFIGCSAVGSAPVLNHIPVASLSSITGGDGAHGLGGRVHLPDNGSTLLGEILRHHTLVLNAPENDARRIAALLNPAAQQTLEVLAEGGDRLAGDDLLADSRLNGHLEKLTRYGALELEGKGAAIAVGLA